MYSFNIPGFAVELSEIPHTKLFRTRESAAAEGQRAAKLIIKTYHPDVPVLCIEIQQGDFAVEHVYVPIEANKGGVGRPRVLPKLEPPLTDPVSLTQFAEQMQLTCTVHFRREAVAYLRTLGFFYNAGLRKWTRTEQPSRFQIPEGTFTMREFMRLNDLTTRDPVYFGKWLRMRGYVFDHDLRVWAASAPVCSCHLPGVCAVHDK